MILLIGIAIVNLVCVILCWGMFTASMQGSFPEIRDRRDVGMGLVAGLMYGGILSLLGLFMCWCLTGFAEHGLSFRYKPPTGWGEKEVVVDKDLSRLRKMAGLK